MRYVGNSLKKFFKLMGDELHSLEEHSIFLYETSITNEEKKGNSNTVREIQRNDKFASKYCKELSEIFLERREIGFGYYRDDLLIGFLWIRLGEYPEQIGRETILIPKDYALLHHLVIEAEYRGKGIGKALLTEFASMANSYNISKIIAFIRSDNVPSIRAFISSGFLHQGSISSKKYLGNKVVTINSPGIPLRKESTSEYRSIIAQSMNFPLKILVKPYIYREERLIDGVFGGRPWLSILSATVLKDSVPAVIHSVPSVGTPVLMPCSVSPGVKLGRLRINFEPTSFHSSPTLNEHTYREIISAIAKVSSSRWIETLNWPLPFWQINDLLKLNLPTGCSIEKTKDPTWIIDIDGSYGKIESRFSKTARTYIRQAEKRGVVICNKPTKEDLNNFANLWFLSFKERGWGGVQYNKLYFFALDKYINNGASIILAKVNEKVVAGGVFIRDKFGYVYLLGAVDRDYDHFRPMYAVINHIVKKVVELEMGYLNLGGTGGRDNLISFKRHWGAQPRETYILRCINPFQNLQTPAGLPDKIYRRFLRYYMRIIRYRFQQLISRGI